MTTPDDRDNPWTWEGAAYAQLRDSVQHSSPTERVRALERLMGLAEASGALKRQRQQEVDYWARLWGSKTTESSTSG